MKLPRKLTLLVLTGLCACAVLIYRQLHPVSSPAHSADTAPASSQHSAPVPPRAGPASSTPITTPPPIATALPPLVAKTRLAPPRPDARPVTDRFAAASVIWSAEQPDGRDPHIVQRIRLVQIEMKYPFVRLEETVRRVQTAEGPRELLLQQVAMVGDHLMVKAATGISADQLASTIAPIGGRIRAHLPASNTYLVEIPATGPESLPQCLAAIGSMGPALKGEPDYLAFATKTPNDPRFSERWDLHNTGLSGKPDADIDAPEAWEVCTGSRNVLVGILDSGIDYSHPDLAANIWTNPNEIPNNGIDDDGNGYVDDTHGWDFVNNDNDPMDDETHGTLCAGIVGAVGNNGNGIAGVNWQVSLVGLKTSNVLGMVASSDTVESVYYANSIGVDVLSISNSSVSGGFSLFLNEAIMATGAQGRLIVAAAANNAADLDEVFTGHRYDTTHLIVVAASENTDQLASFSNFGASCVDLAAPGLDIMSTTTGVGYQLFSGTSAATPVVSGAAALLKAANPQLSGAEIKGLLLTTVDRLPALTGKCVTGGRLNVGRAVNAARHLIVPPTPFDVSGPYGGPFANSSTTDSVRNPGPFPVEFAVEASAPWVALSVTSGTVPAGATTALTVALNDLATALPAGRHAAMVTFRELSSGFTVTREVRLDVVPPPVYSIRLDTDPGWARTGQWAFGQPRLRSWMGGRAPVTGSTGTNAFGVGLTSSYSGGATGPEYLTAGPFNLTGYGQTRLRFQRWLSLEGYSRTLATLDLSVDGTNWIPLWRDSHTISDQDWVPQEFDLSAYADNRAAVYVRWGHQTFEGAQGGYGGWNLDDIEILGQPPRRVTLAPLSPVPETYGRLETAVRIVPAPEAPLTVSVSSSLPGVASVPSSVVLPAGATSTPLTITIHDDNLLNGTREVSLGLQAAGYVGIASILPVRDNESARLTLTIPATAMEGGTPRQGTISCTQAPATPVAVTLISAQPRQIIVPRSVVIPAGATSATFTLIFPENNTKDDPSPVAITVAVPGWTGDTALVAIADNEYLGLGVGMHETVLEDSAGCPGAVSIFCTLPSDLVVSLTSSDTSELTVPPTVIIPAGFTQAEFMGHVVNDGIADGRQTVTVTAQAQGFSNGQCSVVVADPDQYHYTFDPIPSPQSAGVAFPVRITVRNAAEEIVSGYFGQAPITALDGNTVIPRTVMRGRYFFEGGKWEGLVAIHGCGAAIRLQTSCGSVAGASNAFQVVSATPIIDPEPVWSAATDNQVRWSSVPSATAYQVQCATDAAFTAPVSSGWIAALQHTFTGLSDGVTYFYRARASDQPNPDQAPGPWGAMVSSTQDTAGPSLTITSAKAVVAESYILTGTTTDTSGVGSIMIDGTPAATTDGYATWFRAVPLHPGPNAFLVSATDCATPAQTSTREVTVIRLANTGDTDGDGLPDLLEYALGLDPLAATASDTSSVALQPSEGAGKAYLLFTYCRRLLREGLAYDLETSTDLKVWTEIGSPEEISVSANPDGITETVVVRIQPSLDAVTPNLFVRLKVHTP